VEISRCYKDLKKTHRFGEVQTRIMPVDKIKDAFLKLNSILPQDVKKGAITVAENFNKFSLCEGKKPATIAGAAIYMVAMRQRNKMHESEQLLQSISDAVEIGPVTVRECYQ